MTLKELRDQIDNLIDEHGDLPIYKRTGPRPSDIKEVCSICKEETIRVHVIREIGGYKKVDKAAFN